MAIGFLIGIAFVAVVFAAMVGLPLRQGSPRTYIGIVVLFPLLAIALYQWLGTPAALDAAAREPAPVAANAAAHADPAAFAGAVA